MQEYNEAGILVEDRVQFISGAFLNNWSNQLSLAYTAKGNGRIEVFVANESNTNVWFDDLEVSPSSLKYA